MIIETFRNAGIPIDSLTATGGIPQKNELLDRIYADVLGIPVSIAACPQCGAMGAAMLGAYASGIFGSIGDAISAMGAGSSRVYTPDKENAAKYDKLYAEYKTLHDYFGRGENDVMKRLRNI